VADWYNFGGNFGGGVPSSDFDPHVLQQVGGMLGSAWNSLTSGFGSSTAPSQGPQAQPKGAGTMQGPQDLNSLLQSLGAAGTMGGASSGAASSGPAQYITPDGVTITDGSAQDTFYKKVDAIWTKVYGAHAPYAMVQFFHQQGAENTDQLDTIMKGMPSHISNSDGSRVPLGQYEDMKSAGNQLADKFFGRPIPDSLIQQWAKDGVTTPAAIELWFDSNPATSVPKDAYQNIYDNALGWTQQTWNDLPHPAQVANVYANLPK
jgi:hypothetical protein